MFYKGYYVQGIVLIAGKDKKYYICKLNRYLHKDSGDRLWVNCGDKGFWDSQEDALNYIDCINDVFLDEKDFEI